MLIQTLEPHIRRWYIAWIRPHISQEIHRQRLKLIWKAWGYWFLLSIETLRLTERLQLLGRFIKVDWWVLHGHSPEEISYLCRALAERRALPGEVLIEAGCWQGGSSAKLSIVCKMLGYDLCIYDSFQGVEPMSAEEKSESYDFSGEYASPEDVLRDNLERYGEPDVCRIHSGWFSDTLAKTPVPYRVRLAFIDCDLAKGTKEALAGIVPALTNDGWVFLQDFHLLPVRKLISDSSIWESFGKGIPRINRLGYCLASLRFVEGEEFSKTN